MLCCVPDCAREARYKADQLCPLHYHRRRRGGTTDLRRQPTGRYENAKGYQFVYAPEHPLAMSSGFVAEHRKVLYEKIGPGPMACELCGRAMTWATCQPDHIDENPRNNTPGNLRPTCVPCNASRGHTPAFTWSHTHKITHEGETKTPTEWARDPRVEVSGATIIHRKRRGMSDEEALFAPKVTHNGKKKRTRKAGTRPPPPPKHTRSNAVVITIDGVTATAAEWERHPDCHRTNGSIRARIKAGLSHFEAVFGVDGRRAYAQTRQAKGIS